MAMMTVHEVSTLTGLSIRTLQYYDRIGLLHPSSYTEAGYRLYDRDALGRLQTIMLLRELEFPLKEIKKILDSRDGDMGSSLEDQIQLLKLRREHLDRLIAHAEKLRKEGDAYMDFSSFDREKIKEYEDAARERWGGTEAYREYQEKDSRKTDRDRNAAAQGLMDIFLEFADVKEKGPHSDEAQRIAAKLQAYITENFYTCTRTILAGLGKAYGCGGEMNQNIDAYAGEGTGRFASEAVEYYCSR